MRHGLEPLHWYEMHLGDLWLSGKDGKQWFGKPWRWYAGEWSWRMRVTYAQWLDERERSFVKLMRK